MLVTKYWYLDAETSSAGQELFWCYSTELTIDRDCLAILPALVLFRERGFYLAGGTALALFFGHRESEEFDFFTSQEFDARELFDCCQRYYTGQRIEKILEADNTLSITIDLALIIEHIGIPELLGCFSDVSLRNTEISYRYHCSSSHSSTSQMSRILLGSCERIRKIGKKGSNISKKKGRNTGKNPCSHLTIFATLKELQMVPVKV